METKRGTFACERCAKSFTPLARGRKPLYCSHTCRQRAYEARRRGALQHHLPASAELAFIAPRSMPARLGPDPRYESGRHRQVVHALRPDGPADADHRRPTLCGALTRPDLAHRYFGDPRHGRPACRTCRVVAERFPPLQPIDPPADLSRVKHLLTGARLAVIRGDDTVRAQLLDQLYRLTA